MDEDFLPQWTWLLLPLLLHSSSSASRSSFPQTYNSLTHTHTYTYTHRGLASVVTRQKRGEEEKHVQVFIFTSHLSVVLRDIHAQYILFLLYLISCVAWLLLTGQRLQNSSGCAFVCAHAFSCACVRVQAMLLLELISICICKYWYFIWIYQQFLRVPKGHKTTNNNLPFQIVGSGWTQVVSSDPYREFFQPPTFTWRKLWSPTEGEFLNITNPSSVTVTVSIHPLLHPSLHTSSFIFHPSLHPSAYHIIWPSTVHHSSIHHPFTTPSINHHQSLHSAIIHPSSQHLSSLPPNHYIQLLSIYPDNNHPSPIHYPSINQSINQSIVIILVQNHIQKTSQSVCTR